MCQWICGAFTDMSSQTHSRAQLAVSVLAKAKHELSDLSTNFHSLASQAVLLGFCILNQVIFKCCL